MQIEHIDHLLFSPRFSHTHECEMHDMKPIARNCHRAKINLPIGSYDKCWILAVTSYQRAVIFMEYKNGLHVHKVSPNQSLHTDVAFDADTQTVTLQTSHAAKARFYGVKKLRSTREKSQVARRL